MKILFVTQYFPPETGAPQNRLGALASWLYKEGYQVQVLTSMPNYPALQLFPGYVNRKQLTELQYGYPIHRVSLYLKGKSFFSRIRTYLSFCFNAWHFSKSKWQKGEFDWVFCESPPLFLGITAKAIATHTGARFWFNVSDLWPESVEKLRIVTNPILLFPIYRMERWLYQKAHFITGQTQGICKSIHDRTGKNCFWYPNGISEDEIKLDLTLTIPEQIDILLNKKVIIYAGNIGYAQGLEILFYAAEKLIYRNDIVFVLIGDGPEKAKLELIKLSKKIENIFLFSTLPRNLTLKILSKSFASVVPLRNLKIFEGAIPSKIFESLAIGVPVLMGVNGEAKDIFFTNSKATLFFEPENSDSLVKSILDLINNKSLADSLIENGKYKVIKEFNRDLIHRNLFKQVLKYEIDN